MRLPMVLLVLATIALGLSGADATLQKICKAAADKDVCVNYDFCVEELTNHRWGANTDAWGLAMQAADCGVGNAYGAIGDIEVLLAKSGTDAKTKAALRQCDGLYDYMKTSFTEAHDWINEHNYAEGKEEVEEAISQAHKCDDIFAKAAIPSPLAQRGFYSVQIAIVCMAITNLIE